MSDKPTLITEDIYQYILNNFAVENDFFKELKLDAIEIGIPEISISADQAVFLQFIIKALKIENILEVGTLAGYSAFMMANALPDNGKLTTLEIEPLHAEFVRKKALEAGLGSKIEIINQSAVEFLRNYSPEKEIDLAFIDTIYAASPLHDIGKVGVPDDILLKPGKLDDSEWVIMKQHTTIGAK